MKLLININKNLVKFLLLVTVAYGAYLKDIPVTLNQPDGSILHCFASGDEFYNYLHDKNGYTIIQSQEDGYYYYAKNFNNNIVPTTERADSDINPAYQGLYPGVIISKEQYLDRRNNWWNNIATRDTPTTGIVNNLNVFIRFSDEEEFNTPRSIYDIPFNSENGPSMKHYFYEVSYELLTVNTIHYPECDMDVNISYQDQHPRSYYQPYNATTNTNGYTESERTEREHTLLQNAITYIADEVPDSLIIDADGDDYVDNVTFLVSGFPGGWADLLWPHRWALYSVESYINDKRVWDYNFNLSSGPYFSVGTLCHEFGHSLGAPDLYHYWDDVAPVAVGGWDVMDATSDIPQWPSAYIKYRYFDWIELQDASQGGTYTLNPLGEPDNNAYRVDSSNPNEYFVLEYRTQSGIYDTYAPGNDQGIVIYRVNDVYNGQGNANGPPDELYVYRVGGTSNSNGNFGLAVFSADVGRTQFNDSTNPSSFLSDNSLGGVNITNIGPADSTIEFTVLNLVLYGNYIGTSNDSDSDGIINPGESVNLEFNINNISDDVLAYAVTGTLFTDEAIDIPNPVLSFGDVYGGESTFSQFSEIIIDESITLGPAALMFEIDAEYIQGNDLLFYNDTYTFHIDISLNQSGFPYETSFPVSASPVLVDVNQDSQSEIIFGDYDGVIRAFDISGQQIENNVYPYETEDQIWGSPAMADMDLDGHNDFVFSSSDKHLYFFDSMGFNGSVNCESFLIGSPVIGNIDDDDELEVIIGGFSGGDGRKLFAFNHDMTPVLGFPILIGEKIKKGASLADFNNNGKDDIVFGTDSDNIYLILDDGSVADGFPFETNGKIHSSPAILDINGNITIIAGSNDNFLYSINSDGSLHFSFEAEGDVSTSPSILNYLNNCYIVFGDDEGYLYVLDTNGNQHINFPQFIGSNISESIVFSDLNYDSHPEIIFGTDNGEMHAIQLNGNSYNHMPIEYPFSYYSSPTINDIDGDNDLEILAGTSLSINIFDIKDYGTPDSYWSTYKGNPQRTGYFLFIPFCDFGDINGDLMIDVSDIILQINFILNLYEPNASEICASDLDSNGTIDLLDIILLINIILER